MKEKKENYLYTKSKKNKKATMAFPLKSSRVINESESGRGVKGGEEGEVEAFHQNVLS